MGAQSPVKQSNREQHLGDCRADTGVYSDQKVGASALSR